MKYFLILCCLAGTVCAQKQNLKENYTPLASAGPIPELFTMQLRPMVQKEVAALIQSDKKANTDNLLYSYAGIETFVKSGNILFNDEVSAYLERIVDVLLKDKPELRKSIHIYAYKSAAVNAHSFSQGCIFINTGMVAQAETEAQLAYLVAREIAHCTKKHVLGHRGQPGWLIDKVGDQGQGVDDELAELYAYSPADEADADVEAYNLYAQSGYSLKQAQRSFDLLQYSHLPFDLVEFKKSFLETPGYKIPDRYFLKEVSAIASKSNTDDLEGLHPDMNRRKTAVERLISNNSTPGKSNYIVGEPAFTYARDLARFELCRLFLRCRDYPNALYASYILLQKYPDNAYLQETVSKCLYGIALYDNNSLHYTDRVGKPEEIKNYTTVESYPQQIYYLISKMPASEWAFMSLNYAYRAHKRFPANKALGQVADSLFSIVGISDWDVYDFVRTNVKDTAAESSDEPKSKTELIANIQKTKDRERLDTMYYKDIYLDLFMSDKEFSNKFPPPPSLANRNRSGFKDYNGAHSGHQGAKEDKKAPNYLKTDTVIIAAPFNYYISDGKTSEIEPDLNPGEDDFAKMVLTAAGKSKFPAVVAAGETLGTDDADKLADYSLINDWMFEKSEDPDSKTPVLNTDQAGYLTKKYHTPYILKMGFVKTHARNTELILCVSLYDMSKNCIVYSRVERIPTANSYSFVMTSKIYQVLNELKYHRLQVNR